MAKSIYLDLDVIGVARPPNAADLKERDDLKGLPDPGPEAVRRRAELEAEQKAFWERGVPTSFLRRMANVDEAIYAGDAIDVDERIESEETAGRNAESSSSAESVNGEMGADEECDGSEPKRATSVDAQTVDAQTADTPTVDAQIKLDAQMAAELYEAEKPVRNLRNRKAIQLRPYGLEREAHRQKVKARGRKV